MPGWKQNLHFVLVDTLEPGNIGAAARALKNIGFSRLHLVRPKKYPAPEVGWFAHGADDILEKVVVHNNLESCLADFTTIIGTTRRTGKRRGRQIHIGEAAEKIRSLTRQNKVAILFGREDRGLTNEDISRCAFMVNIPASKKNPSFNLAQAVLLVAYEIAAKPQEGPAPRTLVTDREMDHIFNRLWNVMKLSGYRAKGIRDSDERIKTELRRILARTALNPREARMVHGVLSQLEEAVMHRASGNT